MICALLAAAAFTLEPSRVSAAQLKNCIVDETIPLGSGTAQKLSCRASLDQETAARRCRDAARHDALPEDVTKESCPADYARGKFLFPGEMKEVVIARRNNGAAIAAFKVPQGDTLIAFQHFGEAVLIGVGDKRMARFAVISTRGILKAPDLGDPSEIRDVSVVGSRIRVTGRARAMYIDLVPGTHELRVVR